MRPIAAKVDYYGQPLSSLLAIIASNVSKKSQLGKQESIPVGCIPSTFVVRGGGGRIFMGGWEVCYPRRVRHPGGRVSKGSDGYTPRRDMEPEIPYPPKGHRTRDQEGTWYQRYPTPCGLTNTCENIARENPSDQFVLFDRKMRQILLVFQPESD